MFNKFKMILLAAGGILYSTSAFSQVTGAGATFPYPVYAKWAQEYKNKTGNIINYQSIGSGAGIKQIIAKTVTFGATDMPLSQEELDKFGLVQFPMVMGGVVLSIKVNGVTHLTLNSTLISDIYLGKIKKWNDPKIKAFNPTIDFPDVAITPSYRSDGSGTTYLFTRYLANNSSEFQNKVGVGTSVMWPIGLGSKGNEGMANNVKILNGSIAYIEYAYAKQNKLTTVDIKINDKVVSPGRLTFQSGSWPITALTYILMHKKSDNLVAKTEALKFFKWALDNGDKIVDELDYIPLSNDDKDLNIKLWQAMN